VPKKVKLLAGIIVGGTFLVLLFAAGTSQQSETSSPEPITIPEQTQEQREAQQKTEEEVQPRAPVEKQQEEAESQEPEVAEEVPANETYEYKLALINKGGYVREDDTTVNRFRFLLNRIESNTQNTRQEISDMTVKAWQILQSDYGKTVTLLQVMEEANDAVGPETKGMNYADIMSMLIVLMGQ
jgi:hemolysin activation/secretion protein